MLRRGGSGEAAASLEKRLRAALALRWWQVTTT